MDQKETNQKEVTQLQSSYLTTRTEEDMELDMDPTIRRTTVPIRPGLTIDRLEDFKNENGTPTYHIQIQSQYSLPSDAAHPPVQEEGTMDCPPNFCTEIGETVENMEKKTPEVNEESVEGEEQQTYSVSVVPGSFLSIYDFKETCKLNVRNAVEMDIITDWVDICGRSASTIKKSKKNTPDVNEKKNAGASGSVFQEKQKREAKERKRFGGKLLSELPKKMEEKTYMHVKAIQKNEMADLSLQGQRVHLDNMTSRYYVMTQGLDGIFYAHSVINWHTFAPRIKYKTLTYQEADEAFERRNRVLNLFSVMVGKRLRGEAKGDDDEGENSKKSQDDQDDDDTIPPLSKIRKRSQHVDATDVLEWIEDSDLSSDEDEEPETDPKGQNKKSATAAANEKSKSSSSPKKVLPLKIIFPKSKFQLK